MDGTLKFVNYKVEGTQTPIALLRPNTVDSGDSKLSFVTNFVY